MKTKPQLPRLNKIGAWSFLGLWIKQYRYHHKLNSKKLSDLQLAVNIFSELKKATAWWHIKRYHARIGYTANFIKNNVNEY